jgi:chemotaxis protein methyltransferase WspC
MKTPPAAHSVEQLLRRWIGLDPATIGATAIDRAIRLRMAAVDAADRGVYLTMLAADPGERDRLVDEVVVPESWFFRDAAVFTDLRRAALAHRDAPHLRPLALLSVPCAGGEEPYSVAMTMLDAGLPADRFRIDAFDVSHQALGRAVAGRYSANAFRTPDLAFRDRWFTRDGAVAILDERIKRRVSFAWGNLLDPGFHAAHGPYDIVLCRNLLIYLDEDARRQVEQTCDRLLAPDGLLVVGAAEPAMLAGRWTAAGAASSFVLRRVASGPTRSGTAAPSARASDVAGHAPPAPAAAPTPAAGSHGAAAAPAGGPASEAVVREAQALAAAGRVAEAIDCCRQAAKVAPSAGIFFLMARLERQTGSRDQAEACLHKTLYLDPDRADALLELALLAEEQGDRTLADRYRQSATRVLARTGEA